MDQKGERERDWSVLGNRRNNDLTFQSLTTYIFAIFFSICWC